ncbi:nuclear GTPase SLIP-GC-like [Protopterus annectens]|uniref:nuclear GTPase SLIP-GC-like n=1 Tax=Protopterus annectens TaxID=7888 RepID=UPI001CFAD20C|nr:nuclear GTPase SLIP-GC-like [Protopterus annectens]
MDNIRVTPESSEHKGASSEQDVECQMQKCKTVLMDLKNVLSAVEGVDKDDIREWLDQNTELLEQTDSNSDSRKTYIAVIGATGVGKSSLLNALLDEEDLLPSCSMRVCTASVVEVSYNTENQKYEADVEFLTEQEWYTELEALINDLKDTSGNLEEHRPDSDTEAAVAFSRVVAVYGKIAEVEELKQLQDVTRYLGKTVHITEEEVTEFCNEIERFIESSVDSSQSGRGGQYWPIVKCVRLCIPRADVLRSGAVLVDLPGVTDSNPARDSLAKEYLKTCDAIWIVSSITRAADDKTAEDILNKSLRTRLYMDGQYGRIAFICTKTDMYSVKEICRKLPLREKIHPLESKNAVLRKKINQNLNKSKQSHSQDKINELQSKIRFNQQAIALKCIKARNTYSKQQIRQNFRRGLQEIQRVPNKGIDSHGDDDDGNDDNEDDDNDNDDDDDDEISFTSEDIFLGASSEKNRKLHVFSVSAMDYLKLLGKLETEGQPQIFNCLKDTEIPALKDFTIKTAMKKRKLAEKKVIRSVASFISHVVTYLMNHSSQDEAFQEQIREPVEFCLSNVREMMQEAVTECSSNVEESISFLIQIIHSGVEDAIAACEKTARSWGSQGITPGKYPFHTIKAVCVRQGLYSSGIFGTIDFNEELTQPILNSMVTDWDNFFSNDLPRYQNRFKTEVLQKLNIFFIDVMNRLYRMKKSTEAVEKIQRQQMKAAELEVGYTSYDTKTLHRKKN